MAVSSIEKLLMSLVPMLRFTRLWALLKKNDT
jgi:hypothetical protein